MAIVALTKKSQFVEANEDDVEEVLASHDQQLTDEEPMQLQEERIWTKTKCNSKWPENEVIQELKFVKHLHEIFHYEWQCYNDYKKYDFNFERAYRFRTGLEDVLSLQRIVW